MYIIFFATTYSGLQACCGPIIDGVKEADTAEELMRSRFSAYCIHDVNYIVDTTNPTSVAREGSRTHGKHAYTLKVIILAIPPCWHSSFMDSHHVASLSN